MKDSSNKYRFLQEQFLQEQMDLMGMNVVVWEFDKVMLFKQ